MQGQFLDIINNYGYLGIVLLMFAENVFPPIPSEVILTFGGFMTTFGGLKIWFVVIFATLGSLAGAFVLYYLGSILQEKGIKRLASGKIGKAVRLKPEHVEKALRWFERYSGKSVFIGRFVPVVRSLISIPAGMSHMPMPRFVLLTTVASALWNTLLVCIGAFAGNAWETEAKYVNVGSSILLIAIVIVVVIVYIVRKRKRG